MAVNGVDIGLLSVKLKYYKW